MLCYSVQNICQTRISVGILYALFLYETWSWKAKSRKYRGMFEVLIPENLRQVLEKDWSQQVEYASPKCDGTRCPEE